MSRKSWLERGSGGGCGGERGGEPRARKRAHFCTFVGRTSSIGHPKAVFRRRVSNPRSDTRPGKPNDVMERSEVRGEVPSKFMKRWKKCSPVHDSFSSHLSPSDSRLLLYTVSLAASNTAERPRCLTCTRLQSRIDPFCHARTQRTFEWLVKDMSRLSH